MPPIHLLDGSSCAPAGRTTVPIRARGIEASADNLWLAGRADDALDAAASCPRGRAELGAHAAPARAAGRHADRAGLGRGQPHYPLAERRVPVGGPYIGEEQQPRCLCRDCDRHRHLVVIERGQRVGRVVAVDDGQQAATARLAQQLTEVTHRPRRRKVAAGNQNLAHLDADSRRQLPVQRHQRWLAHRGRQGNVHGLRPRLSLVITSTVVLAAASRPATRSAGHSPPSWPARQRPRGIDDRTEPTRARSAGAAPAVGPSKASSRRPRRAAPEVTRMISWPARWAAAIWLTRPAMTSRARPSRLAMELEPSLITCLVTG